ncbi:hypothetical protein OROHE_013646 [Orobanche hederae]
MGNIKAATFSVLVNGKPYGFFKASRGIKQGDPLSPFLFIIFTEAFTRTLSFLFNHTKIDYYKLPYCARRITSLSFADDTVVFLKANMHSLENLMEFLKKYELPTGQKINIEKSSHSLSDSAPVAYHRMVSDITNVPKGVFPFKYLGCPIFIGRKKHSYFQPLFDNIVAKLITWLNKWLNQAGRLNLAKHVLSAIPLHILRVIKPTNGVLERLHVIFAKIFWGTSEYGQNKVWRSWENMSYPYLENGLAVKNLHTLVNAFSVETPKGA